MAVVDRALIQRVQVAAAPEIALELLGLAARRGDGEELVKDEIPRHERHHEQQRDNELNDDARVPYQCQNRQVLGDVHAATSSFLRIAAGTPIAFRVRASTHASVSSADTILSSPRFTERAKTSRARPTRETRTPPASMAFRRP